MMMQLHLNHMGAVVIQIAVYVLNYTYTTWLNLFASDLICILRCVVFGAKPKLFHQMCLLAFLWVDNTTDASCPQMMCQQVDRGTRGDPAMNRITVGGK